MRYKLKMFPKFFIVVFVSILITILLFIIVFRFFMSSYLSNYYSSEFEKTSNAVQEYIGKNGINATLNSNYLDKVQREAGVTVVVYDNNQELMYPLSNQRVVENNMNESELEYSINYFPEGEENETEDYESDGQPKVLSYKFSVYENEQVYNIALSYFSQFGSTELSNLFISISPFIIIFGGVVAFLVAYLYARVHVNKIKRLNIIMSQMEQQTYRELKEPARGDELIDLENHIDTLYKKLITEMNTIRKFEKDREVFMKGSIHELKTPMMAIRLQLDELMNSQLSDEQINLVHSCSNRITMMNQLVSDVLRITKLESIITEQSISVDNVLQTISDNYTYLLEDKQMCLKIDSDYQEANISVNDLSKIISNLISNAIKYGCVQSIIYISWKKQVLTIRNVVEANVELEGDLMSPFTTQDHSGDSTGLGLYIVSIILHKYNLKYEINRNDSMFKFTIFF